MTNSLNGYALAAATNAFQVLDIDDDAVRVAAVVSAYLKACEERGLVMTIQRAVPVVAVTPKERRPETPIERRSRLEWEMNRCRTSDPERCRELQDEIEAVSDEIRAARKAG